MMVFNIAKEVTESTLMSRKVKTLDFFVDLLTALSNNLGIMNEGGVLVGVCSLLLGRAVLTPTPALVGMNGICCCCWDIGSGVTKT